MRVQEIDSAVVEPLKPRKMRARWDEACRRPALDVVLALENAGTEWNDAVKTAYFRALAINLAIQVDSLREKSDKKRHAGHKAGASLAGKLVDDSQTLELLLLSMEMMDLAVEPATLPEKAASDSTDWRQASRARTRAGKMMHFLGMLTDGVMDSVKLAAGASPGQKASNG